MEGDIQLRFQSHDGGEFDHAMLPAPRLAGGRRNGLTMAEAVSDHGDQRVAGHTKSVGLILSLANSPVPIREGDHEPALLGGIEQCGILHGYSSFNPRSLRILW